MAQSYTWKRSKLGHGELNDIMGLNSTGVHVGGGNCHSSVKTICWAVVEEACELVLSPLHLGENVKNKHYRN